MDFLKLTEFYYSFVANSHNKKLGNMVTVSTSSNSCPLSCGLYNDCYGKMGNTRIHWSRLDKNGLSYAELCHLLNGLRKKTKVRFNVVGDLASDNDQKSDNTPIIDATKLLKLSNIVKSRMLDMILYTHHSIDDVLNVEALKIAFSKGLHINISCETIEKAKKALNYGLNAVIVLPLDSINKVLKIDALTLVRCPAEYNAKIQCVNCMLCAKNRVDKKIVIVFTAHGTSKKRLSTKLMGLNDANL
jgi:hypothetical protein